LPFTILRVLLFAAAAITLSAEPQRIVSTAPSITETVYALSAGNRLVGVTNYCHYPPEALKITKIGTYLEPHTETILALKPDLVITEDSPIHSKDLFSTLGLHVLKVRFETVADIYASIRSIAAALGVSARGEALVASISRDLEAVRKSVAGRKPVSVMFLVGRTPNVLEGMVATGNASYMNEVMQIAGGRNVFRDAPMRYFRVSQEQIIARNPEVILDMGDMADTAGVTEAHKREVVDLWNRMPTLQAVAHHRVYAIASDIYVVPGPRVVECARAFARTFYPEAGR
jgi:iron complex transport system substrate-binding protein